MAKQWVGQISPSGTSCETPFDSLDESYAQSHRAFPSSSSDGTAGEDEYSFQDVV